MDASYSQQYQTLWRKHWWWVARHRLVLEKVGEILRRREAGQPTATLLDIGCAGGVAFDDLSGVADVYGLEPDPVLHATAGRWLPRIEPAAFSGAYSARRSYDLVLMLDVLEHIEDDVAAVANLQRLLRPGGYVLLTVPALPSLWSVHDEVNHHFRRYRADGLHQLLSDSGFEVIELRYAFCWSLGLLYLRRWLARRGPESYEVRVPSAVVNRTFLWLTRLEERLSRLVRVSPPCGSSLLAVVRKPLKREAAASSLVGRGSRTRVGLHAPPGQEVIPG